MLFCSVGQLYKEYFNHTSQVQTNCLRDTGRQALSNTPEPTRILQRLTRRLPKLLAVCDMLSKTWKSYIFFNWKRPWSRCMEKETRNVSCRWNYQQLFSEQDFGSWNHFEKLLPGTASQIRYGRRHKQMWSCKWPVISWTKVQTTSLGISGMTTD